MRYTIHATALQASTYFGKWRALLTPFLVGIQLPPAEQFCQPVCSKGEDFMSALLDHGVANEYLDTVGLRAALFAGQERERCLGPEGPRIMQELGQALLTKGRELCHGTCSKISGTVQKDGYARAHGHVDIQSDETNRRVSDSLSPFAALARELLELFQALTALLEQILIEPDCAGLKERAFAKLALLHAHVNVIEGRFI